MPSSIPCGGFGGGLHAGDTGYGRPSRLREDVPARQVVGGTARCVPRTFCFLVYTTWAAFQGEHYRIRSVSLAVLRAGVVGRFAARLVRHQPAVVAGIHAVLAGAADPAVPRRLPLHLLLLPRRLLQSVLGGSAVLRRRRAAQGLPGRELVPADPAEHPPLLLVHRRSSSSFLLSYDVWLALWFDNPATGAKEFGIGVGTIVLLVNVVLLTSYTLGCHSAAAPGRRTQGRVSKSPIERAPATTARPSLNTRHQLFAWCSLFSVAFADIYVRLCSMGIWTDLRII